MYSTLAWNPPFTHHLHWSIGNYNIYSLKVIWCVLYTSTLLIYIAWQFCHVIVCFCTDVNFLIVRVGHSISIYWICMFMSYLTLHQISQGILCCGWDVPFSVHGEFPGPHVLRKVDLELYILCSIFNLCVWPGYPAFKWL